MNLFSFSIFLTLFSRLSLVQALPRLLVYTKTAGFRHDSIPQAIQTIKSLGNGEITLDPSLVDQDVKDVRWDTVSSEDESLFEQQGWLEQFDAIAFVMVTDVDPPGQGTILRNAGIARLAEYIQKGGGYIGIHSASNALYGTPFYGRLVGSFFSYHVELQSQSFSPIPGVSHPSINNLPKVFTLQEELYNYRTDPRDLESPATILLSPSSNMSSSRTDPGRNQSWRNGTNGPNPHPLSWWRESGLLDSKKDGTDYGGGLDDAKDSDSNGQVRAQGGEGRSWYTSLGHEIDSWNGNILRSHVFGGIAWTLKSGTVKSNNEIAVVGQEEDDEVKSSGESGGFGSESKNILETSSGSTDSDSDGNASSSSPSFVVHFGLSILLSVVGSYFVLM